MLQQNYMDLLQGMTEDQWTMFANVCWAIWRCRNDRAYGGKEISIQLFQQYLITIGIETRISRSKAHLHTTGEIRSHHVSTDYICILDGSWEQGWQGGIGYVIKKGEELLQYCSKRVQSCCPLQSEVLALKEAVSGVQILGIDSCTFLTDCKVLADLVSNLNLPVDADWTVFLEIQQLWLLFRTNELYHCQHQSRDLNTLADYLAKKGRTENWDYLGHTYPLYRDWYEYG